jgi:PAS domain S-box-containing protein
MRQKVPADAARPVIVAEQLDELKALYRLTDRLYRARSLRDVYEASLDAIVGTLGCDRASILLFDNAGIMRFVAWRGLSERYRQAVEGHSPWRPGDRDPEPIFVPDIADTGESDEIKTAIAGEGIRGLGFIPIVAQGAVVGKFMTYYGAPHPFPDHEVELAVTIARQVGFSVERAHAERSRQRAEEELRDSEARFRLMSEHAPVMIWMSHPDGSCLYLNRMLRSFWNVDEAAVAHFDWQTTIHPGDAPDIAARIQNAIRERSSVTLKGRYRNGEGEYRVLQTDARPRFSAQDEFLGMIGVNVDVTERELAEQSLRQSEERFRLAVEAAPSGMVMTDGAGVIVMANANAATLLGYAPDELIGRPIEALVPERFKRTHPAYRETYRGRPTSRAMGDGRDLFALRKDGTELPVEIGLSPIETPTGPMVIAAVVDISGRKRGEAQRELLLAELNHRVKNTLAVVQAIARQTFRNAGAQEARKAFEGRLAALAVAHNLLTRENWENASLERLAAEALHADDANGQRVVLAGPRVLLPPKQALAITMALHELFVNAVKYGALSRDGGRVVLEWQREDGPEPRLRLIWREAGGPEVSAPTNSGFGTFLVERALAQDLEGSVSMDYAPSGLVCRIDAPFPIGRRYAL